MGRDESHCAAGRQEARRLRRIGRRHLGYGRPTAVRVTRGSMAEASGREAGPEVLYDDDRLRVVALQHGRRGRAGLGGTVAVSGDVDITNSAALAEVLAGVRNGGGVVMVDACELEFVDVSGLRVLALPHTPPAERWLRLTNVPSYVAELLKLLDWDDALC